MVARPIRAVADALPPVAFRGTYYAQQAARVVTNLALHARYQVARPPGDAEGVAEAANTVRRRYLELLRRDLDAVEEGLVPRHLLLARPDPVRTWRLARLLAGGRDIKQRRAAKAWRELPPDAPLESFPPYYRRTFHWQRDGYLSDRSAAMYEVGVELLFLGGADVMRRAVLPPIVRHVRAMGRRARVLDLACGTGATLASLAETLPGAHLGGVDLSPWYLKEARRQLSGAPHIDLVQAAGEQLPMADRTWDVTTSTYLFHELPRAVRREVVGEVMRVTRPGGLIVIEDAAQLSESAEIEPILRLFPRDFHEPYFEDYLGDPLEAVLAEAGAEVVSVAPAYLSKVVVARVPA